jgi:hypothetical protein
VNLTQHSGAQAAVNWEETQDTVCVKALYINGINLERKRYAAGNSQEFPIVICYIESQNQTLIDGYCSQVREPQDKNDGTGSGGGSGYGGSDNVEES